MIYYLYILKCRDGSLYTGITNNLPKRLQCHQKGRGSKYVRSRLPVELIYVMECATKSTALKNEINIKKLSRQRKLELIENSIHFGINEKN